MAWLYSALLGLCVCLACTKADWARVGWARVGWARLGWARVGWARVGWARLRLAALGWVRWIKLNVA
jgi:hypothetical protein